jgi:hypothetical protein
MSNARRFLDRTNERRLPADWAGDVMVWDIDKTYLDTRFSSLRGLLAIPFEFAVDKRHVAGTVPLLRALRLGADPSRPRLTPLFFVSGSPPGLRDVVERRMTLDGVQFDGITFKDQLALLRAGRPRAIKEQVGYKLCALLLLRHDLPVGARYFLFGDDVESDPDVFLLFGAVLAGLRGTALRQRMRNLGAGRPEIEAAVELASPLPIGDDPVERVFIHGVKGRLIGQDALDPRVVATKASLQTALVLRQLGRVAQGTPARVAADLREHGFSDHDVAALCADARDRLGVFDVRLTTS